MSTASGAEPTGVTGGAPRVSVVMTAYSDLRFIEEAVDSILQQRFRDLELIIVDDGTKQDEIFKTIASRDPRIRLLVNPVNLGTAAAGNRGIEVARADIIVRLDADDVAEPERIERLVLTLDQHPEIGLVGSAVTLIDENGVRQGVQRMPESDLEIRWTILFHNPLYHSTVAFRRELFEKAGRYIAAELVSQDHYLWFHILPLCRARNLAEPLTRYRLNSRGLVATHSMNYRARTHRIRQVLWAQIGVTYNLYDDSLAEDVSRFLRHDDIAAADRRAAAYKVVLTMLRRFLTASRPFRCVEDAEAARSLTRNIVARILAKPPADWHEMLMICRLSWPLNRRAAFKALIALVADEVDRLRTVARQRVAQLRLK